MRWGLVTLAVALNGLTSTFSGFAQPGAGEPTRVSLIQGKVEAVTRDGFVVAEKTGPQVRYWNVSVNRHTSFKFDAWTPVPYVVKPGDKVAVSARVRPDGEAVADAV